MFLNIIKTHLPLNSRSHKDIKKLFNLVEQFDIIIIEIPNGLDILTNLIQNYNYELYNFSPRDNSYFLIRLKLKFLLRDIAFSCGNIEYNHKNSIVITNDKNFNFLGYKNTKNLYDNRPDDIFYYMGPNINLIATKTIENATDKSVSILFKLVGI